MKRIYLSPTTKVCEIDNANILQTSNATFSISLTDFDGESDANSRGAEDEEDLW